MPRLLKCGLLIAILVQCIGCCDPVCQELKKNDFTLVVPPSTLYAPGTIVAVRQRNPTSLDIVCDQSSAVGTPDLATSLSTDVSHQEKTSAEFKMDVTYLQQLTGNLDLKGVQDVTYSIKNVKIQELTGNGAVAAERKRSPNCSTAIDRETRPITMIRTVYMGDVVYTVNFDSSVSLSVDAKQNLIKNLAGALSATVTNTGSQTMQGVGLIWGIRDNPAYVTPKRSGYVAAQLPDARLLVRHERVVNPR